MLFSFCAKVILIPGLVNMAGVVSPASYSCSNNDKLTVYCLQSLFLQLLDNMMVLMSVCVAKLLP